MLSYIPKRLAVYLIKKEFEDEVSELKKQDIYHQFNLSNDNSKYLYQAYIFPLKEANHYRTLYLSNHLGIDRDKYELVVFDNSEIKIKLNLRKTQYRAYDTRYCLELHHSSFEGRKYQPYICISCRDFLNILNKYELNLVDSELSSVFKIKIMNLGAFPNYSIVSEDFINSNRFLKWSIDYYDLCTTKKHTSKWIPGHIYSLKNRNIFLYLGLGKDIRRKIVHHFGDYSTDMIELFTNNKLNDIINYSPLKKSKIINYDNVKIVIPLSQEQLNSLLIFEGKRLTIEDFIKGIISINPKFFNNTGYHTGLCYFKNDKPLVAMDLGKYIDIVDFNKTNIYPEIVDYITEGIINSQDEETIEDFKIFSKDDIIKLINNNEKYRDLFMLSLLKEGSYGIRTLISKLPTTNTNPGITGKELIDSILNFDTLNIKLSSTFVEETISNLQGIIKAFLSNNPIKDFKISDFYKLTEDFIKNL